ncbi:hypothetical protein PR202_ga00377 [Eleusine coracana subsp. coracana]|uniref:Uncharacterized protein n=1 Tax=Eleusine coracana subsp. coracana TaxID=191504 RepID=A0AAV5BHA6_ELECO|nr:hypothetical protein PR202_ga00377 [Eleusine coracana subsp. coracana]
MAGRRPPPPSSSSFPPLPLAAADPIAGGADLAAGGSDPAVAAVDLAAAGPAAPPPAPPRRRRCRPRRGTADQRRRPHLAAAVPWARPRRRRRAGPVPYTGLGMPPSLQPVAALTSVMGWLVLTDGVASTDTDLTAVLLAAQTEATVAVERARAAALAWERELAAVDVLYHRATEVQRYLNTVAAH